MTLCKHHHREDVKGHTPSEFFFFYICMPMYIKVGVFSINHQICWPFSIIFCQYFSYIFGNYLLLGKIRKLCVP